MVRASIKDPSIFQAVSFGCYDTLVDTEASVWQLLEDDGLVESFVGEKEDFFAWYGPRLAALQAAPFRPHHEVLGSLLHEGLRRYGVKIDEQSALRLADRCAKWQPFPEIATALRRIGSRWPLYLVSNGEHLVLRRTLERIGIPFAEIIGSDDVRAYKPAKNHFQEILKRHRQPASTVLHVAASVDRDLDTAAGLGFATVEVRRGSRTAAPVDRGAAAAPAPGPDAAPRLGFVDDLLQLASALGI